MGSTIETLQDTVIRITDDQKNNSGGNNIGGNKNGESNNNGEGNNNDENNAHNCNGGGNNISNSGNFGGIYRRRGLFYYTTMDRVKSTRMHDMHHVPNSRR